MKFEYLKRDVMLLTNGVIKMQDFIRLIPGIYKIMTSKQSLPAFMKRWK